MRYEKEIEKVDKNTTVLTESGRNIHKSHIRNQFYIISDFYTTCSN